MTGVGTHTMTGYQANNVASASVVVPAPVLALEANKTAVAAGEVVTFRLYADGVLSPADAWQFVPDTGSGHDQACSSGAAECEKIVRVSGTMIATRTISAAVYTASRHVVVEGDCDTISGAGAGTGAVLNLVGAPCSGDGSGGSGGSGDSTGTVYRLTVIRSGQVVQNAGSNVKLPVGSDTIAVFAYDAGRVIGYGFSAGTGYFDVRVILDDTIQAGLEGSFVMERDRVLTVDARPRFLNRTRAFTYRQSYVDLLLSAQPVEHYRAMLQQIVASAVVDPTVWEDVKLGAQLLFDEAQPPAALPTANLLNRLVQLEEALAGWSFRFVESSPGSVSVIAIPPDTAPPVAVVATAPSTRVTTRPSTISAGAKPVIRYVNGVLNETSNVVDAWSALKELLEARGLGPDSVDVRYIVNKEQLRDAINGHISACVVRALSQPPMSERQVRIVYADCRARTEVVGGALYPIIKYHDFAEAVFQKISIWTQHWSTAPIVATTVSNQMYNDIALAQHGIWVAHSQGNFVVAQGIGKLKQRVPQLQQGVCTAVVSLASPVKMVDFGIAPNYVLGFTTAYDVLQMNFLGDPTATPVESNVIRSIDERPLWDLRPKGNLFDQLAAHSVMNNYFLDPTGANMVRTAIGTLMSRCNAIP